VQRRARVRERGDNSRRARVYLLSSDLRLGVTFGSSLRNLRLALTFGSSLRDLRLALAFGGSLRNLRLALAFGSGLRNLRLGVTFGSFSKSRGGDEKCAAQQSDAKKMHFDLLSLSRCAAR
jgi:hypothetical protein